jgi:hypothetical protein
MLSDLLLHQRTNLAERLKVAESICERLIGFLSELPNPTSCLKRLKKETKAARQPVIKKKDTPIMFIKPPVQYIEPPVQNLEPSVQVHQFDQKSSKQTFGQQSIISLPALNTSFKPESIPSIQRPSVSETTKSDSPLTESFRQKFSSSLLAHSPVCICERCLNLRKLILVTAEVGERAEQLRINRRMPRDLLAYQVLNESGATLKKLLRGSVPWEKLNETQKMQYRRVHLWCCSCGEFGASAGSGGTKRKLDSFNDTPVANDKL